ncbi:hypothetical protein BZK40_05940 [Citrobacter portucalensis]|nr:hypothetical protein P10159_2488 [Citrobacter portucalensis]ATX91267.1 hypothetical protein AM348_06345 [Citrobacter freundii]OPW94974.1 hypothetical protein BZK40_05940 [Citrobacter portucalensis]OPX53725.1 hypothetical protein B5P53_01845 [Citrobacter portucalensis]
MPPGIKPPQHCASPGIPGLPLILRQPTCHITAQYCALRSASQFTHFLTSTLERFFPVGNIPADH